MTRDGSWRIYKLRPDFFPADKVQFEDDITASVVLPRESLNDLDPEYANPSVKLVANCELLLFQRPDDAIHRGADPQAEADMAGEAAFISNYEPISIEQAVSMVEHVVEFDRYAEPMKGLIEDFARTMRQRRTGPRSFLGAPADRGWPAFEKPALLAEAARSGGAPGKLPHRNRGPPGARSSCRKAGPFPGERRAFRTEK